MTQIPIDLRLRGGKRKIRTGSQKGWTAHKAPPHTCRDTPPSHLEIQEAGLLIPLDMRSLRLKEVTPVALGCTAVKSKQARGSLFQHTGPPLKPTPCSPHAGGQELLSSVFPVANLITGS